jgi:YQGE family putative transporter
LKLPWSDLSPQAKRGLLTHALHWQAVQVGQLYVSVFLFRLSHGYALPALHAICQYALIPPGYWLAAVMTRRWGAATSLRTGLTVYAIYQACILALGPGAAAWAGPLGALWGLGVGLYWQAWVLLIIDYSRDGHDRDAMLGSNQALYFLANFTGAPVAGLFLARFSGTTGYPWAFGAALLLFAAAWTVSLGLKGQPHHGAGAVRRLLKVRKPKGWNASMLSTVFMGLMNVGALFLPMLLAYESGGSEGYGGVYAALTALAGFVASALVGRWGHPERRGGWLFWSACSVAVLVFPLALHRAYGLVLLYGLGTAIAMSAFNVPLFATQISIMESEPRFRHRRADAMFIREWPLALGRCIACGTILFFVQDMRSFALGALLSFLALCPLMNYATLRPWLIRRPA